MSKTIALTGTSGAMGSEVLISLLKSPQNFNIRCIFFDKEKIVVPAYLKKILKKNANRVYAFKGDISRSGDCEHLIEGADYVINCASIIPPLSDHDSIGTFKSNYIGTKNIVDAITASGRADEISLIHIATVAIYGHRADPHVWIRVGDPVISSDYDVYSKQKLKAERYVLESGLKKFVSLRQTAMFHKNIFKNNTNDGLMFHTVWNGALEWVTDLDSAKLCTNLIEKDSEGKLEDFWKKIYNIGGGEKCRLTGFESIDISFSLLGGGVKKYFKPNWNITRNFHGGWFYDSDELEEKLNFRNEDPEMFWKRMAKKHRLLKLVKLVPPALVSSAFFGKLFKSTNAPKYWLKNGIEGRVKAFFGSRAKYAEIPENWDNYNLLCEGKDEKGNAVDYAAYKDIKNAASKLLDHGYDESKDLKDLTLEDLQKAAEFRGGECAAKSYNKNPYEKLAWKCRKGHEFNLTPYTVLKGGYWCADCCEPSPWRYGAIADIPFYGQVYFDSHDKNEVDDEYPTFVHEEDFIKK